MRTPDFEQLLKVLARKEPDRPTLFEFFLNDRIYARLAGRPRPGREKGLLAWGKWMIDAFHAAGYDYTTTSTGIFYYPIGERRHGASVSLNEGAAITDRKSFDAYPWPDPDAVDYSFFADIAPALPAGMKLIVPGPGGIQENAIDIMGFDNLCYLFYEDPQLVEDVFYEIGSRMVRFYEHVLQFDTVGAVISNDDWGHKSQTMFSPSLMRRYIFPWHRRIVEAAHNAGRPVILHSCGNLSQVMEDVIDMGYDAKHSYQDVIEPVEEAYEHLVGRIAVLGGIDLDFVCRRSIPEIRQRCQDMLARSRGRGGYALGTGNSVPEYVPDENILALLDVVRQQ